MGLGVNLLVWETSRFHDLVWYLPRPGDTSLHDLVRLSFGLQACQVHLVSLRPLIRPSRAVNPIVPAEEIHPSEGCTDYLPRPGDRPVSTIWYVPLVYKRARCTL